MKKSILLIVAIALLMSCTNQDSIVPDVKVLTNHLGYYPDGPKHAVVSGTVENEVSNFYVKEYETREVVFEGKVE